MRQQLLFCALSALGLCYLDHKLFGVLLASYLFVFHLRHFRRHHMIYLVMLIYFQMMAYLPEDHAKPVSTAVTVKEISSSYVIADTGKERVMLYGLEQAGFDDELEIEGEYEVIDGIHNIGEFHFPTWAKRKGIHYAMQVKSSRTLRQGSSIRAHLYRYVQRLPKQQKNILAAMLFGLHEDNVYYMMTSSGMHISYLMQGIYSLLVLWLSHTAASMISILSCLALGSATVMSTTLKRLICFRVIRLLLPDLSRKDQLGVGILILLVLYPGIQYELGFVLPICFRFVHLFNVQKIQARILQPLILIPLQLFFFQSIDMVSMLLFPMLRKLYGFMYISCLLVLVLPVLTFLTEYLYGIHGLVQETAAVMEPLYASPHIVWMMLWIYQLFLYVSYRNRKALLSMGVLLVYTQISSYLDPFLHVDMLDIGQGDCTLIRLPFHQGNMLIDVAGSRNKNIPADIIYPILRKRGIHSLDKVVITHDDFDHSGGLQQLQELMEIKEVVREKREIITLGYVSFSTLLWQQQYEDKNENSIILFLDIFDTRLLFMGDAGIEAEQEILKQYPKLKADILKAGHHGSKTSSSLSFLHRLNPNIALISCGRNNRYGHPNKEVLESMENETIYPLISAGQGEAQIFLSQYFRFYRTAEHEFGIITKR